MNFTAQDVKTLREKTGVGMMECKKALTEADGDMDKAIEVLRERGLAASVKKAGRTAADGVVLAYTDDEKQVSVLVEVNSETDFVAKNDKFQAFVLDVAKTIVEENPADVEALNNSKIFGSDRTVQETIQDLILAIGENMKIRRFERVEGTTCTYIHAGGSVGVMVNFDSDVANNEEFKEMGRNIAMQIAAMNPDYLSSEDISDEEAAKMKSFTIDSALNRPETLPIPILNSLIDEVITGKKWTDEDIAIYTGLDNKQKKNFTNFISKEALEILAGVAVSHKADITENKIFTGLVQGRIAKQVKEVCLMEQAFVRSDLFDGNVKGYVADVAKKLGGNIKCTGYTRYAKGEGIEKKQDDFAAEIASMVK